MPCVRCATERRAHVSSITRDNGARLTTYFLTLSESLEEPVHVEQPTYKRKTDKSCQQNNPISMSSLVFFIFFTFTKTRLFYPNSEKNSIDWWIKILSTLGLEKKKLFIQQNCFVVFKEEF